MVITYPCDVRTKAAPRQYGSRLGKGNKRGANTSHNAVTLQYILSGLDKACGAQKAMQHTYHASSASCSTEKKKCHS